MVFSQHDCARSVLEYKETKTQKLGNYSQGNYQETSTLKTLCRSKLVTQGPQLVKSPAWFSWRSSSLRTSLFTGHPKPVRDNYLRGRKVAFLI